MENLSAGLSTSLEMLHERIQEIDPQREDSEHGSVVFVDRNSSPLIRAQRTNADQMSTCAAPPILQMDNCDGSAPSEALCSDSETT